MPFIGQLEPDALVRQFVEHPPHGFDAEWLPGGICAFTAPFDILTTAEPAMRERVARWPLYRHWRGWLKPNARFIGSTVTEYAVLPGTFDPAALAIALRSSQAQACPLLIIKDIPQSSPLLDDAANAWAGAFAQSCADAGFVMLEGQALAWLPIDFASTDEYLTRLSRGRRRDIRRKLRSRADLSVEMLPTGMAFADDALLEHFHALYRNVHAQSDVHFDFLGAEFLAAVLRDGDNGGVVFVYRHAGAMIGWNLCFEYGDALVDKYIGLAYPQARQHNLYAVSWMHNLEYAIARGLRRYVAGWTDAQAKAQLGARFTLTRHAVYPRNRLVRWALKRLSSHFESDSALSQDLSTHATADP